MSHVNLIAEIRAYICQKNVRSVGCLTDWFSRRIYSKTHFTGNEE